MRTRVGTTARSICTAPNVLLLCHLARRSERKSSAVASGIKSGHDLSKASNYSTWEGPLEMGTVNQFNTMWDHRWGMDSTTNQQRVNYAELLSMDSKAILINVFQNFDLTRSFDYCTRTCVPSSGSEYPSMGLGTEQGSEVTAPIWTRLQPTAAPRFLTRAWDYSMYLTLYIYGEITAAATEWCELLPASM